MGADLYNDQQLEVNPELKAARARMDAMLEAGVSDDTRDEYRKLYDIVYGNPLYYFRDSYNDSSLLWVMELSWWNDISPLCDIQPGDNLTDEEYEQWYTENPNNMSAEGCSKFLDLLESRKHLLDELPDEDWEEGKDWETGEPYRINVTEHRRNKYDRLIAFVTQAREDGGMNASL